MMNAFVENVRKKIKTKTPTPKSEANKEKRQRKKEAKKKLKEQARLEDSGPGVVYVGHIPHGFYEKEMTKYFSQFGKVMKIRLAKSRKTMKSKGYAFIQFKSVEVAKIVAETMNNYLFFEKLLKCEYIPQEKVHPDMFKAWKFRTTTSDINRKRNNAEKSKERLQRNREKRIAKLDKLKDYLKNSNIEFEMDVPKSNKE